MTPEAWTAVGGILVGLVSAVVAAVVMVLNTRHTHKKEDQKTALDQALEVIAVLRTDMDKIKGEIKEVREEHKTCQFRLASAEGQISVLKNALALAKIPMPSFLTTADEGDGS